MATNGGSDATTTPTSLHKDKPELVALKFLLGAISCAAPLPVVNPIEVIKIRLQLQGELANERSQSSITRIYGSQRTYRGTFRGILHIIHEERIAGLYKGITPAAMREMTYAAFRLAAYDPIKEFLGEGTSNDKREFPLWKKILAGASAGAIGAAIANPTDVLKVRMQAAGKVPRYKNTWDGFSTIVRMEGVLGLWKGVVPNIQRAAVLSAAMMSTYDHCKTLLLRHGWIQQDSHWLHITASMCAGFVMSVVSTPIDVVKTRIMNRSSVTTTTVTVGTGTGTLAEPIYRGMIDCLWKTFKAEGVQGLYKGFIPTFMRLGPHTIMALVIFEKLRSWAGLAPV